MSKNDWNALYDEYVEACKDSTSLSMAEFARAKNLNVNSARRSLNKIKKEREGDHSKSDRSPKKADRSRKPNKSDRPVAARGKSRGGEKTTPLTGASRKKKKSSEEPDHKNGLSYPSRETMGLPARNVGGLNFSGTTHGGYMDLAKVDEDIREAAGLLNETGGIVQLMSARYLQMYRTQQQALEKLEEDYANEQPWKDDLGNVMPMSQAKSRIIFGASEPMTKVESALAKFQQKQQQIAIEEERLYYMQREAHPLTKVEQMEFTEQLIAFKDEKELSGVEAAYLFERQGLPVPSIVMAEANKEIAMREPEKPDLPEITAEELDALMDEFETQNEEWDTAFMEERQAAIAQLDNQEGEDVVEVIE
ncbi:hypothetical protein CWC12_10185 [Pseudoalteromonas ruthenica]|nr:hypothetical protein CWC12_10185 [Pseudoalteromonas ruthenica]TMP22283.1 hypothetical protein CWC06_15825 [Pseudoalteromonas ruthenica]